MSRRSKISLVIMVALGALIGWYAARDIKFSVLVKDIFTINPWWLLVALACILLYFALEAWITYILVRHNDSNFTFWDALRVPLVEQLFNGITPFSAGGQPAQLVVLIQSGVDGGKASSALLMKFLVYQSMIVINFCISLVVAFNYVIDKVHALALFVLFGFAIHLFVIIGLLMVMYWNSFTKKLVNFCFKPVKWFVKDDTFYKWKTTLNEKIDNFYQESLKIGHQWKLMAKVFIITFFQLLFYYMIPYFIMLALGYDNANIVVVTSLNVLIFLVISIFPIPGGAGGAEYSFETLFSSYISNGSKLVLAMILWRLLTYYLGLILGVFALVKRPSKIARKAKTVQEKART